MNENPPPTHENSDDFLSKKLFDYIEAESITADELRDAYYLFCGVTTEHSSTRVHATANLMSEMSNEHYPINRFVSMISNLEEWEDAPLRLISYIDNLPITEKEKAMLKSIPEKARAGELHLLVDGKMAARVIIKTAQNSPGFHLALYKKIEDALATSGAGSDSDVSFWFEEK